MLIICLYTVKWSQVLQFNRDNCIYLEFLININDLHTAVWLSVRKIISLIPSFMFFVLLSYFNNTGGSVSSVVVILGNECDDLNSSPG